MSHGSLNPAAKTQFSNRNCRQVEQERSETVEEPGGLAGPRLKTVRLGLAEKVAVKVGNSVDSGDRRNMLFEAEFTVVGEPVRVGALIKIIKNQKACKMFFSIGFYCRNKIR